MTERPLECSGCVKDADITYSEVADGKRAEFICCHECPALQQKLHGTQADLPRDLDIQGVCCGNCKTDLHAVKTNSPLGCFECYHVFEDAIRRELGTNRSHIGRSKAAPELSNRITELNVELNEALKKENYEQAAWLRDQIKELMNENS